MDSCKRLRGIWRGMKRRCLKPCPSDFYNGIAACYHDKGITICEEWVSSFESFYEWAMKNGYSDALTIDRIDPDRGYTPDNCRWITLLENVRRARRSSGRRDNPSAVKSKNYFMIKHHCGTSWAIVKETRVSYSEAIGKRREAELEPGCVILILRHKKPYLKIKPGDIIDYPIEREGGD